MALGFTTRSIQFVLWPPIELVHAEKDAMHDWELHISLPHLFLQQGDGDSIFEWSIMLGWLEIRRFSPPYRIRPEP